ncbi:MAG: hypothetical protein NTV48_01510 [Candidatus Vogelbacteria bacterium]|nr:hypothetical protein [Candidatus Vogelbacteria bacterium]
MATWAGKRRFLYFMYVFGFFAVIALIILVIYWPRPTCFDQKKNQDETGIDCGGSCSLACSAEVSPLRVYWTRPLAVSDGVYDAMASVENQNLGLGTREIKYEIYLYDQGNLLLGKRAGQTFVNPGEKFYIFESLINVGNFQATKAVISFLPGTVWEKAISVPKNILLERKDFIPQPTPHLSLQVTNTSLDEIQNIKLYTVLSDVNSNAFAGSATILDKLVGGEKKDVFFTWPKNFTESPSYIDFGLRINGFVPLVK